MEEMISFQQMCENLTQDQRYSWFIFPQNLLPFILDEEKQIVHIQPDINGFYCRIWYPKEKWSNRQRGEEEIKIELLQALEDGDVEKIKQLKEMTKK